MGRRRPRGLAEHPPKQLRPEEGPGTRPPGHGLQTALAPIPSGAGEGNLRRVGGDSTPEQQLAVRELFNGGARRRYLAALAATGNTEDASRIADVNPDTVYHWRKQDPTLGPQEADARARFGQKLLSKTTAAVLNADPEQLVKTPTLAIAAVNWYNPELRPQGAPLQVAVQVNLTDKLSTTRLEEIASACEASE